MSSPEEVSDGVGEEQLGREIGSDNPILALSLEKPLLLVEDEWLTEMMVPLSSKHLNLSKWRSIAALFDLSTEAALAETRLIVEGRLTELGHDPFGIQVVLSDSDNDESVLYLVNEGGIIKK